MTLADAIKAPPRVMDPTALAALLAPAIGLDRAKLAVENAIKLLGLRSGPISEEDAQRVLTSLNTVGGLTSVAARRAASTLKSRASAEYPSFVRAEAGATPLAVESGTVVTRLEISALLAHAVGSAAARAAVDRCAAKVGFGLVGSVEAAQKVLEQISTEPGLVGITARFAKARLALRKGG